MLRQTPTALQIRVALADIEPAIWRRLEVPWSWRLDQLHLGIQAAFNWWNYHLHEFRAGGLRYGDPGLIEDDSFDDDQRLFDEREVRLRDFDRAGARFEYLYDFGDSWVHFVDIEKPLALDAEPKHAACIDGARARPPEDVGGVSGYEHIETKQWCGGHFDPEWFDLALVDRHMKNALRANVRRRLHQPKPKRPKSSS